MRIAATPINLQYHPLVAFCLLRATQPPEYSCGGLLKHSKSAVGGWRQVALYLLNGQNVIIHRPTADINGNWMHAAIDPPDERRNDQSALATETPGRRGLADTVGTRGLLAQQNDDELYLPVPGNCSIASLLLDLSDKFIARPTNQN